MVTPFAKVIININWERYDSSLGAGERGKKHVRG